MAKISLFKVEIGEIEGLADRVGKISPAQLVDATVGALNETIENTYELARDRITAGINITDDYLRRRMDVEPAQKGKQIASIVAYGDSLRLTRLVHYGAEMVIVPRKTNSPSKARGSSLRIPNGSKQGGVRVNVKAPKQMNNAFMLPLRAGNVQGEKLGVFIRENGALKHLYGPSVYQLFRYQAPLIETEATNMLRNAVLSRVDDEIQRNI